MCFWVTEHVRYLNKQKYNVENQSSKCADWPFCVCVIFIISDHFFSQEMLSENVIRKQEKMSPSNQSFMKKSSALTSRDRASWGVGKRHE